MILILCQIAGAQWPEVWSLGDIHGSTASNAGFELVVTCITSAVVLGGESAVRIIGEFAIFFYEEGDTGQIKKIEKAVRKQVLNVYAFICLVVMNLVSTSWGANLLGFPKRLINSQTCGRVAHIFDGNRDTPVGEFPQGLWQVMCLIGGMVACLIVKREDCVRWGMQLQD